MSLLVQIQALLASVSKVSHPHDSQVNLSRCGRAGVELLQLGCTNPMETLEINPLPTHAAACWALANGEYQHWLQSVTLTG